VEEYTNQATKRHKEQSEMFFIAYEVEITNPKKIIYIGA
jgi:hypothetical protein